MDIPDWLEEKKPEQKNIFPVYPGREAFRAHTKTSHPETSHEAASSLPFSKIRQSQKDVLWIFRNFGKMTDTELIERYNRVGKPRQSPSGIRSRRSELRDRGLIAWNGEYRVLVSGRKSRVWEIVE